MAGTINETSRDRKGSELETLGTALLGEHEGNTKNSLGTINGCYIPCLLNILGAVLFLRVGFSIGMMGFWGSMGIFAFSELIAYLTITSFSAIVTNGKMAGGGAYFMISRNLGPAFGGSSGILFWFTYCINVTFNTVAFTQMIQLTVWGSNSESWWGKTQCNPGDHTCYWNQVAISTVTLFSLFLIAIAGAGAFAKVNYVIFAALAVSTVASIGSLFFKSENIHITPSSCINANISYNDCNYSGFSWKRLSENLYPPEHPVPSDQCASAAAFGSAQVEGQHCTLQLVFAVIFPAVVGMMEGANLSGDLANPAKSIPLGTWAAVSTAFGCYVALIFGQAGTMSRRALQYDMNVMQDSTVGSGYFVVTGVTAACLSTALGSMFGSARILQAIARDDIYPYTSFFAKGTRKGDEPRRAVVFSYLIAQAGILLGNLDDVAPILTNFFLLTYCLVNLACFLLVSSSIPNFRPTYRVYSWQTSLAGAILIIVVMFYLNVVYASITVAVILLLYAYIAWRFRNNTKWVDISQAVLFKVARGALLTIVQQTFKQWRPSLLFVTSTHHMVTPGFSQAALFVNDLKKSGLLIVGLPLRGTSAVALDVPKKGTIFYNNAPDAAKGLSQHLDKINGLKAFGQVAVGPTWGLAVENLMLGAGLGSMVPNTLVLPLPESNSTAEQESDEYVAAMQTAMALGKSLMLLTNFDSAAATGGSIDMWVLGTVGEPGDESDSGLQLSMLMQFGQITYIKNKRAAGGIFSGGSAPALRLRQLTAPLSAEDEVEQDRRLADWVRWARIKSNTTTERKSVSALAALHSNLDWRWLDDTDRIMAVNKQLRQEASQSSKLLMVLPPPTAEDGKSAPPAAMYLAQLQALTEGLPPTVLTLNAQGAPIITTEI